MVTRQEIPRSARTHERLREARGKGHLQSFWRNHSPPNTLTSDFKPPEQGNNKFLLFQATKAMVISYGSPRKLIPPPLGRKKRVSS